MKRDTKDAVYVRPKTVRFDLQTFQKIEIAADLFGMTTSGYIRHLTEIAVAKIQLDQVLPEES